MRLYEGFGLCKQTKALILSTERLSSRWRNRYPCRPREHNAPGTPRVTTFYFTMNSRHLSLSSALLLTLLLAGCGGSRITLEGYNDAMLSNKTVVIVLPPNDLVTLDNPDAYAEARGSSGAVGRELLLGDLQTALPAALITRFDSNAVASYASLPVSGSFPIHPVNDFDGNEPKFWDKMKSLGREGKIEYLVVMKRIDVTAAPSSSGGRGREGANADFVLLDLNRGRVMTSGSVSVSQQEVEMPETLYQRLAKELSSKLPFHIRSEK